MMKSQRRKIISLPLTGGILAVSILAYLLGWSSIFAVESVAIQGAPNDAVRIQIEKMSQIRVGEKLARVNPAAAARKIAKVDWVNDVAISRNWINGSILIEITPRVPLAFFNSDLVPGQTIDKDGALFSLPDYKNPDLASISAKNPESALKANELFLTLPAAFREKITSMMATSSNTFTLMYQGEGRAIRIRWGDSKDIALKISVIEKLLQLPENKKITVIDVVAPHAPIVK
jgi:cell division septal protein FtsQ